MSIVQFGRAVILVSVMRAKLGREQNAGKKGDCEQSTFDRSRRINALIFFLSIASIGWDQWCRYSGFQLNGVTYYRFGGGKDDYET